MPKEDITEYISKNTIIPFLFEAAQDKCEIAFQPDRALWRLLRDDPDRYFYATVKKGIELRLPLEIEAGLDNVSKRTEWNKPASEQYALPTETWRELVGRRKHYAEVRAKLEAGEVHSINDLITYNLDIRQFAQDAIENCEGPDLLRAFYQSIEQVTVLDPTCGSGAFLFAALNILEPLYEACLDRMQAFVSDRERLNEFTEPHGRKISLQSLSDFRATLKQIDRHPNRRYFILKSIIINNLYGVDIMEEATEICKLRLFLKLAAQIDRVEDIEPLPDIDFNIRAGNTLVGFASYDETKKTIESKATGKGTKREEVAFQDQMIFDNRLERIEQKAQEIERAFHDFRNLQTEIQLHPIDMTENKQHIREMLETLRSELDRYLASEYGIDNDNITKKEVYEEKLALWQQSHQPFHWWVEFYGIMKRGGFDVIIGNPPYVEYSKIRGEYSIKDYQTEICGNLYAYILERSLKLVNKSALLGLITPHSLAATYRMAPIQKILIDKMNGMYSYYSRRPGKLFEGADQCLCIFIGAFKEAEILSMTGSVSTTYQRWYTEERANLFGKINYTSLQLPQEWEQFHVLPKLGELIEYKILEKISKQKSLGNFMLDSGKEFYCHRIARYFIKSTNFIPYFCSERDGVKRSDDFKVYYVADTPTSVFAVAILNSSLFYWFWRVMFDGYHCGKDNIAVFPFNPRTVSVELIQELNSLEKKLMASFIANSARKTVQYKGSGIVEYDEFNVKYSKPIIDEIDRELAKHYGFTEEELDFIINYDIKYRMGRDEEVEE